MSTVEPNLRFEPATHSYYFGDQYFPSVTEVLEPEQRLEGIAPAVLAAAKVRGQHVHEACALLTQDALDWSSLDPLLVGYASAARLFLKESGVIVLRSEHRMCDPQLKVAGTLDLYGRMRRYDCVFDYKTALARSRTEGLQLAGYEHLHRRMYGGRALKRFVVQLREDGQYRLWPYEDPRDFSLFVSCLNLWHWRNSWR
jgi:hypothetical protein